MIKAILACDKNGVIGNKNKLPWNIKSEMNFFQSNIMNQNVLIGKTTFLSLKNGLPKAKNVFILSDDLTIRAERANERIVTNIGFINSYKNSKKDIFICGGLSIYLQTINLVDEVILSFIKDEYYGDIKINLNLFENFIMFKEIEYDEFNVKYLVNKSS
ncbi:dihydrofolate reductase [Mycoplasma anserisalpingitidis]|uniref:dihydrofolate reductase n=1 Tax=Mycoplasma anserisalpingitidis TaxID=519450 RepID=A0A5B8K6A3_9MOLU|nr:dihydrofolate reductase [Mycoplasma anserisalpingitidis]QDY88565.1 dihydrofolate reductase [Mycoplasma anserisalpingitidis]